MVVKVLWKLLCVREREVEKMFYLVLLHFHCLYTFIGISSFESQGAKPCNTTVCMLHCL